MYIITSYPTFTWVIYEVVRSLHLRLHGQDDLATGRPQGGPPLQGLAGEGTSGAVDPIMDLSLVQFQVEVDM